ncbi:MAG: response regulator [Anaerolineales bacterium]
MPKILIVDDDESASMLLEKIVAMSGNDPISINDSTKALALAKAESPELFLLDLMMPNLNGYELCELLRSEPQFEKTPIIVVSAMEDVSSKTKAREAGANDYVTKPYHIDDLIERMNKLLKA